MVNPPFNTSLEYGQKPHLHFPDWTQHSMFCHLPQGVFCMGPIKKTHHSVLDLPSHILGQRSHVSSSSMRSEAEEAFLSLQQYLGTDLKPNVTPL